MECGICYAYRLNDLIPDKACDDSRCGQPFHSLCLYEVSKIIICSQTFHKQPPKMPRFSARLRDVDTYESLTRGGLYWEQV